MKALKTMIASAVFLAVAGQVHAEGSPSNPNVGTWENLTTCEGFPIVIQTIGTIFSDKTAITTNETDQLTSNLHGVWEKEGKNQIRVKYQGRSFDPAFPVPTFVTVTALSTVAKDGATASGTVRIENTYEGTPFITLDCTVESTRLTL